MNDDTLLHKRHEELTNQIYNTPGMLPSRYVYILTNLCNLNCDFCFQQKKLKKDRMTQEDWIRLTKQLPSYARVTLTGGEPLMFNGFKQIFSYVAERFECNLITNGTLLSKELIDFMIKFKKFKILSLSIDNKGNTLRKIKPELWQKTEETIRYFINKREEINPDCALDIKSLILDENAEELFEFYKYCREELKCDFHVFHFLKGSPIQHSDVMFDFEEALIPNLAPVYQKWEKIKQELEKIRVYNLKTKRGSYLHPKVGSLTSSTKLIYLNQINDPVYKSERYKLCKYPWSSVHINSDGALFPCLAISMGNVKKTPLARIIGGAEMTKFRNTLRKKGTIAACNRCGWSKLNDLQEDV
jgi:MoaA/NifB/PqqE/SkfB family radical SAM enzyme